MKSPIYIVHFKYLLLKKTLNDEPFFTVYKYKYYSLNHF